ncbi:MAG: EamA family transporter [Rhizobiaceae bacterium]
MELWVLITVGAAFLQNLRSTLQKYLKGAMGTTGATFVRFGFGLPFAIMFVALLHLAGGMVIPAPNLEFLIWVVIGALSQIFANALLIHLFSFRNFVVGTAYSRTESAQAAIFGFVFLDERINAGILVAIAVAVIGVMLISVAKAGEGARAIVTAIFSRTAGIGILSGTFFGLAAVAYRAASLSLGYPGYLMQAAVTLLWTISLQTIVMLIWMAWRERDEIGRIIAAWKPALATGFVGATASFGWFTAMTLQQAAIVKAVALIEIVFTVLSSVLFFRERINRLETIGTALIIAGILGILLLGNR